MNSPYLTVAELVQLFSERKYNEQGLGHKSKPGMIEQALRRIYIAAGATAVPSKHTHDLKMEMRGFFGNDADKDFVRLRFEMRYNSNSKKMQIFYLRAVLNPLSEDKVGDKDVSQGFFLTDTRQLPDSKSVYEALAEKRIGKVLELYPNILKKPTIQKARHI